MPRFAASALTLGTFGLLVAGCAHEPAGPPALATIDIVDVEGHRGTLAYAQGMVLVIDICMASADVCLINAQAMSDVCDALCGDDVEMVTLLVDETGHEAARSYLDVLQVKHRVYLPGPQARGGGSALGQLTDVPRVVIFDKDGHRVDDQTGALLIAVPLAERIKELQ